MVPAILNIGAESAQFERIVQKINSIFGTHPEELNLETARVQVCHKGETQREDRTNITVLQWETPILNGSKECKDFVCALRELYHDGHVAIVEANSKPSTVPPR